LRGRRDPFSTPPLLWVAGPLLVVARAARGIVATDANLVPAAAEVWYNISPER
jgi:hypothetical protein